MAQVLTKQYTCYSCKKNILISKVDDPNSKRKWDQWELDAVTPHKCNEKQQQHHQGSSSAQTQQQQKIERLASEIAELRAEVRNLVAVIQFLRLEQSKEKNEKDKTK